MTAVTPSHPRILLVLAAAMGNFLGCAARVDHVTLVLDGSRQFQGVIEYPATPTGAGVLLLGGGYTNDIDWTTHGVVRVEGREVRSTLSGASHSDAPVLSRALTDAGFVVMRYSAIRQGDPMHASDPATNETLPFLDGLELSRRALAEFRRTEGVDRVYLVGHSLGATRAALIADEDIAGLIFLAGAYLSRTTDSPRTLSRAAATQPAPEAVDLDGDGHLAGWECAAARLESDTSEYFLYSLPWPIDRLREIKKPILAVFGGLDPISLHGPSLSALPMTVVRYMPGLGHQLGDEAAGELWALTAPIESGVVQLCTRWMVETDQRWRVRPERK